MFPESTRRHLAAFCYRLDCHRSGESSVLSYLREFERTQFLPADQLQQLRLDRLRAITRHAYENCEFYRERFDQADVDCETIVDLDSLQRFPILEKHDIQQHGEKLIAKNLHPRQLRKNFTGGSTGQPLPLVQDHQRYCSRKAATRRHDQWAGWRVGDKVAHVWGATPDIPVGGWKTRLRNELIDRALFFDSGSIAEADIREFHRSLDRFRPRVIHAYAKSLALVARYFRDHSLTPFQPAGIITSAETLTPEDRHLIEAVFGAPVFNRYGCRETSVIASECEHHRLHVMAEGLIVEVVTPAGPVAPGEPGSVLITDLLNRGMPLIRYRVGDVAVPRDGVCPCGRHLPMLERVEGRLTDFLVGADGRLVSGPFFSTYLIGKRPELGQVQILQEVAGQLLINVTCKPSPDDILFMETTCQKMFGAAVKVDLQHVDEIPRSPTGKLIVCRSTATNSFVQLDSVASSTDA